MFKHKCEMCGLAFETNNTRAKYCIYCRDKAQVARNRAYAEKKKSGNAVKIGSEQVCPICGNTYTVTSGSQKYCKECTANKKRKKSAPNTEYLKGHYDYIRVNVPKGEREKIKAYAESQGMSVNKLMLTALEEYKLNGTKFYIKLTDVVLPYKLFTLEEIQYELLNGECAETISYELLKGDYLDIKKKLKQKANSYFAYIKFFICNNNTKYGLVGGKTNTWNADISFDYEYTDGKLTSISRGFLKENKYQWYKGILLIQLKNKNTTNEQQALFLENYIQRRFNLFSS